MIALCIEEGADVNAIDALNRTPAHIAAYFDHKDCLQELVQSDASVNARDSQQKLPLHHSAFVGSYECINYLISRKEIEVNAKDYLNRTPLHYACCGISKGHTEVADLLI